MAVTTKKQFPNAVGTNGQSATVFTPVGIQLNNQDDLDVYVTLSGGTRVLQLRQATGSTAQSSHPQVNNTDGLYFPAVSAGTTLYNYQLSTDNNTITFSTALPTGATVFVERRTRDADSSYTTFASGSTIRATDLNNSSTESNFTAQDGRNKALTIEGVLFDGDQPSTNFVTSSHIVDGSIVNADINASADIAGTKLADDSVTLAKLGGGALPTDITVASANIVNGTIVEDDIANSVVTSNKIADNAITTTEILNGAVTRAKLEADAIDGTKLADNAVDSEHYTDGSIDRVHLEADIIDSTKLADNAVNSEHYVDGSIDRVHLAADIVDGTKIADDSIDSEHVAAGALDNEHYAAGSITSDKLNGATVVTNSEQAASTPNDTSFFTTAAAEARYFNASTGETIKDGDSFPDNDTTIATTAAINDRIIDLVDDVGGFVPIANETSFPNANPDVNNGTGTIVSISTLASNHTSNGSGTFTISNGTVGNSTVTINGAANNTTYSAGYGLLVETTTTLNTYTFHRLVPKATEVTTVAGKATEIGRLGTAAAVEDLSILGTADVVADLNTLGTADVVSDMNALAVSDVISDMNTLAVTSVINDMDTVATNVANVNLTGGSIANVNTTAGSIANVNTVAGSIANVNTTAGSISNVNTTAGSISNVNSVASNMANVNNFADRYQIAANNPTTDGGGNALAAGDLYFNTSANELKVYNGSSWQGGVTASGTFAATTGNTFTGDNRYNDNVKALFGTGSDLEIYHDGTSTQYVNGNSNSFIKTGLSHYLRVAGNEAAIDCLANTNVKLYYDNSVKLQTESGGAETIGTHFATKFSSTNTSTPPAEFTSSVTSNEAGLLLRRSSETNGDYGGLEFHNHPSSITSYRKGGIYFQANGTGFGRGEMLFCNDIVGDSSNVGVGDVKLKLDASGNIQIPNDNAKLQLGASQDLQIYHDGSLNKIDNSGTTPLYITVNNYGEYAAQFIANGAVNLYYDGSKKLETTSTGTKVTGDILTEHSGGIIQTLQATTGAQSYLKFINSDTGSGAFTDGLLVGLDNDETAAFWLYENKNMRFATNGTERLTITSDGNLRIPADSKYLQLGASQDLIMYHDGSHSYIANATGTLHIMGKSGENSIQAQPDGKVELYYDNSKKLETTSGGVNVIGNLVADCNNGVIDPDSYTNHFATGAIQDGSGWGVNGITFGAGTGHMVAMGSNGSNFYQAYGDGSNANSLSTYQVVTPAGAVELFYNGIKTAFTSLDAWNVYGRSANSGMVEIASNQGANNNDRFRLHKTSASSTLSIQNYTSGSWENNLKAIGNGAVELYYDNVKRFETTAQGALVGASYTAHSLADDFIVSNSGDSCGITIAANSSGRSSINFADAESTNIGFMEYNHSANRFRQYVNDILAVQITDDATVTLGKSNFGGSSGLKVYGNGGTARKDSLLVLNASASVAQRGAGVSVGGNTESIASFYCRKDTATDSDGGNAFLESKGDLTLNVEDSETGIDINGNGSVDLYYDNSKKLETVTGGANVTGALGVNTTSPASTIDARADSNATVTARNTGTVASIAISVGSSTNQLVSRGVNSSTARDMIFMQGTTTTTRLDSNGHFRPETNNTYDLGTTSNRWRNIYTQDLQLSNEAVGDNGIDGTWGNFTIVEGESDLFLKNNRSGKTYKFNLTEVS